MLQISLTLLILAALTLGIDPIQRFFPKPRDSHLIWAVFVIYLLGNLHFTIFSRISGSGTYLDPRPFGTYLRMSETIDANFQNTTGFAKIFLQDISVFTSVILNILLYYPMGYLLTILFPRLKPWQIVLICCAASVATELTQHLMQMGWCEMDDILCNTSGGAIGLLIRRRQKRRIGTRK